MTFPAYDLCIRLWIKGIGTKVCKMGGISVCMILMNNIVGMKHDDTFDSHFQNTLPLPRLGSLLVRFSKVFFICSDQRCYTIAAL